jgi:hypothetical protein
MDLRLGPPLVPAPRTVVCRAEHRTTFVGKRPSESPSCRVCDSLIKAQYFGLKDARDIISGYNCPRCTVMVAAVESACRGLASTDLKFGISLEDGSRIGEWPPKDLSGVTEKMDFNKIRIILKFFGERPDKKLLLFNEPGENMGVGPLVSILVSC